MTPTSVLVVASDVSASDAEQAMPALPQQPQTAM
jgi:hypothetical protein